jgi:hypothetical protein
VSILNAERLIELRLDRGVRLPILATAGAAPSVMATVYAIAAMRTGGRSPNAIGEHRRAIMIIRRRAASGGVSAQEHLQAGMLV